MPECCAREAVAGAKDAMESGADARHAAAAGPPVPRDPPLPPSSEAERKVSGVAESGAQSSGGRAAEAGGGAGGIRVDGGDAPPGYAFAAVGIDVDVGENPFGDPPEVGDGSDGALGGGAVGLAARASTVDVSIVGDGIGLGVGRAEPAGAAAATGSGPGGADGGTAQRVVRARRLGPGGISGSAGDSVVAADATDGAATQTPATRDGAAGGARGGDDGVLESKGGESAGGGGGRPREREDDGGGARRESESDDGSDGESDADSTGSGYDAFSGPTGALELPFSAGQREVVRVGMVKRSLETKLRRPGCRLWFNGSELTDDEATLALVGFGDVAAVGVRFGDEIVIERETHLGAAPVR